MEPIYQTDGNGKWWKKYIKEKCNKSIFVNHFCQREEGHEGEHWAYMQSGAFLSSLKNGGCSIVYPDCKEYISPEHIQHEYYLSKSSDWIEILDKDEISKIEQQEKDQEISVDRPFQE